MRATPDARRRRSRRWPTAVRANDSQQPRDRSTAFISRPAGQLGRDDVRPGRRGHGGRRQRLVRRPPDHACPRPPQTLAELTGLDKPSCAAALRNVLRAGSAVTPPDDQRPVFAFRLHQFLSKGDTVYVSLEPEDTRHITGSYQVRVPGHPDKALLPLGLLPRVRPGVPRGRPHHGRRRRASFVSRRDADASGGDAVTGYLYISADNPWPDDADRDQAASPRPGWSPTPTTDRVAVIESKREVPARRPRVAAPGRRRGRHRHRPPGLVRPHPVRVLPALRRLLRAGPRPATSASSPPSTPRAAPARPRCCPRRSVRSLKSLPETQLPPTARKLLTFVDNRQDASPAGRPLQRLRRRSAQLRAALYRGAGDAGAERPRRHDDLAERGHRRPRPARSPTYASDPDAKFGAAKDAERALRDVSATASTATSSAAGASPCPTSSRPACSRSHYRVLAELAADEESWAGTYPPATDQRRAARRSCARSCSTTCAASCAIDVDYLTADGFDRLKRRSPRQHLVVPWALDEDEPRWSRPASPSRGRPRRAATTRGARRLRPRRLRPVPAPRRRRPAGQRLAQVRRRASGSSATCSGSSSRAGLLVAEPTDAGRQPGLPAQRRRPALASPATAAPARHDPLRKSFAGEETARVNPFFVALLPRRRRRLRRACRPREHTAQVAAGGARGARGRRSATASLPLLYCSPTMELGVDIAEPQRRRPAQRAADARQLRPALRPRRPQRAAGARLHLLLHRQRPRQLLLPPLRARWSPARCAPPRLDLANEDLVRSHVHAIWLAETERVAEVLASPTSSTLDGERARPSRCSPTSWHADHRRRRRRRAARSTRAERVLATCGRPGRRRLVTPTAGSTRRSRPGRRACGFDRACDRWRDLYRAALDRVRTTQNKLDRRRLAPAPTTATSARAAAAPRPQSQLELLRDDDSRGTVPVRLLQLPLLRQRGLPARLLLPAPAALGLHPRPPRRQARRRLPVSARASSRSASSGPQPRSTTRAPAT